MRIPGIKTLKRMGRQVRSRIMQGGVILGYHHIAPVCDDPFDLYVSPECFDKHMAFLRQHMHPLPLAQLTLQAQTNNLPPRAVAVTFDDGYIDNLEIALPILQKYEIPATVFITTGVLGGEFWWDELQRLMTYISPAQLQTAVPHLKSHNLMTLYQWLLPLSETIRQENLQKLWDITGAKNLPSPSMMTEAEVKQLADDPLINIGSHTVTHPLLDQLSSSKQKDEIYVSKKTLEAILNQPISAFSYPNGRYSTKTIKLVKQAGYTLACCSTNDSVWSKSQTESLPRIWPKNEPIKPLIQQWIN